MLNVMICIAYFTSPLSPTQTSKQINKTPKINMEKKKMILLHWFTMSPIFQLYGGGGGGGGGNQFG